MPALLFLLLTVLRADPATPDAETGRCGASADAEEGSVAPVERTVSLMGTTARVRVEGRSRAAAIRASEAAVDAMRDAEALLSTWRDDTELARVNAAPVGTRVTPSPALASLLAEAERWARRTHRAFEPAVGTLVDAWDLRGDGRAPAPDALQAALEAVGPAGLEVDPEGGTVVRRHAAAWLDAGGFGKGAALRTAARRLRKLGVCRAVLDLGGQLHVLGPEPLEVAVAHPAHRHEPVARLRVADASVATSGQSQRRVIIDGAAYGHVLDPRTGRPVPPWGSVTVVHHDPVAADVLATALFVLGPGEALRTADALDVAALLLVVEGDGLAAHMSDAMADLQPEVLPFSTPSSPQTWSER